ncbi:MAG: oligosaccharide flippase family protein, partial [Pseudomonadota bacterium]
MPTIISVLRTRLGGDTMLGKGAAMAMARGINILSGFLLAVVLARVLGANGYGTYLFALAIAQMLAMPSMMGLPALLMRQIAIYASEERYELINGIVRWGLKLVLIATFVVSLGFGAFVLSKSITSGRPTSLELYVWIVPFVLATGLMSWASAILHGFQRPFWASLPDGTIRPLLLLGAVAAFASLGQLTPISAMGLHVAATTMAFVWAAIMVWRYCDLGGEVHLGARADSDQRAWFSSLWPLFLTVAAATINSKLDLVMLGALRPSGDVALYGLAVQ